MTSALHSLGEHLTARITDVEQDANDPSFPSALATYHRGMADGLRYARQLVLRLHQRAADAAPQVEPQHEGANHV